MIYDRYVELNTRILTEIYDLHANLFIIFSEFNNRLDERKVIKLQESNGFLDRLLHDSYYINETLSNLLRHNIYGSLDMSNVFYDGENVLTAFPKDRGRDFNIVLMFDNLKQVQAIDEMLDTYFKYFYKDYSKSNDTIKLDETEIINGFFPSVFTLNNALLSHLKIVNKKVVDFLEFITNGDL